MYRVFCPHLRIAGGLLFARVAELAYAPDLGSGGQPWGFNSPLSHHENKGYLVRSVSIWRMELAACGDRIEEFKVTSKEGCYEKR